MSVRARDVVERPAGAARFAPLLASRHQRHHRHTAHAQKQPSIGSAASSFSVEPTASAVSTPYGGVAVSTLSMADALQAYEPVQDRNKGPYNRNRCFGRNWGSWCKQVG